MQSQLNHHSGDADNQSFFTVGDPRPFEPRTHEDISEELARYVQGYSLEAQGATSERSTIINTTKLLSGLISGATEEATGRALYRNILLLNKQVGPMFEAVTNNNFDIAAEHRNVREQRSRLLDSISATETLAQVVPLAPDTTSFKYSLELASTRKLTELEEEIPVVTGRPAQLARKEAIRERLDAYIRSLKSDFVDKTDAYAIAHQAYQNAQISLPQLRRSKESLVILEKFLDSLAANQRMVVTRVNSALSGDPIANPTHLVSIQLKLRGKATLHNGEILDPLTGFHLPGIIHLLYEHYCVESLNYYFDALIELFNYNMTVTEAQTQPDVAFSRLLTMSNDWRMRGLYERLSHDLLYTCIAVKAIPPSEQLRAHLIRQTTGYMRRLQSQTDTSTSATPVFDFVGDTITNWVQDKRLQDHPGFTTASTPPNTNNNNNSKPIRTNPYRGRYNNTNFPAAPPAASTGLESAALATTPAAASAHSPPPRVECGTSRFHGEVAASRNLSHNGQPYVAYKSRSSICAQCFPDSGPANPCARASRHYLGHCTRCNYYGHKLQNCLHTHGADGKPLP